jgi:hypothetical protein
MTGPRDWDQELAKIDKLIAEGGGGPVGKRGAEKAPATGPGPAPVGLRPPPSALGVWARVLLGAVLAAAMTQWPWVHSCGVALGLYFATTGLVIVAGGWAALASWRRRMGLAHIVSLGVVFWGLALAASVLLPRVGYAAEAATWWCG